MLIEKKVRFTKRWLIVLRPLLAAIGAGKVFAFVSFNQAGIGIALASAGESTTNGFFGVLLLAVGRLVGSTLSVQFCSLNHSSTLAFEEFLMLQICFFISVCREK